MDDWNEERKDRVLEREYLGALMTDINASRVMLDNHQMHMEDRLGFVEELMEPQALSMVGVANERLEFLMWRGVYWVNTLEWTMNVYEELKSSGQLAVIQDKELRRVLSQIDLLLTRTSEKEQVTINFQVLDVSPYMQTWLNTKHIFRHKADWDLMPKSWEQAGPPSDWEGLLSDPEAQDLLAGMYLELGHQIIDFKVIREAYKQAEDLISSRLSEN